MILYSLLSSTRLTSSHNMNYIGFVDVLGTTIHGSIGYPSTALCLPKYLFFNFNCHIHPSSTTVDYAWGWITMSSSLLTHILLFLAFSLMDQVPCDGYFIALQAKSYFYLSHLYSFKWNLLLSFLCDVCTKVYEYMQY